MFLLTLFFSIMFRTWTTCVEPQAKRNCIGYNEPGIWQDCWRFLNWLWMEPRIYFNFRELAQGRGRCWILKVLLSLWGWNVYSCLNVYYRIFVCPTSFEIDLQVWPNFYSFFFFFLTVNLFSSVIALLSTITTFYGKVRIAGRKQLIANKWWQL